jgi:hypothetical protein
MISAIEWIPVGRANPNPSKYEYSRAERDFLSQLAAASQLQREVEEEGEGTISIDPSTKETGGGDDTGSNDDEWEDVDDDEEEEEEENIAEDIEGVNSSSKLPKVDPSSLPADLRMDEYSDDDDDDDNDGDRDVGGLLGVGKVRLRCFVYDMNCLLIIVCVRHELWPIARLLQKFVQLIFYCNISLSLRHCWHIGNH